MFSFIIQNNNILIKPNHNNKYDFFYHDYDYFIFYYSNSFWLLIRTAQYCLK